VRKKVARHGSARVEVELILHEAPAVRTTTEQWPPQLGDVVLPKQMSQIAWLPQQQGRRVAEGGGTGISYGSRQPQDRNVSTKSGFAAFTTEVQEV
jgi:hypothetical protein